MKQPATFATRLGTIAVLDHGVSFIRATSVPPETLDELATGAKTKTGSTGAYISKDELEVLVTMDNKRLDVLIAPADLEKVIKMSAASPEQQTEIVGAIQTMLGREGEKTEKQAGLFAKSGIQIVWAVGAAIITPLLYLAAIEGGFETHDASDISGSHRTEKVALYWLSKILGPTGTLIVGAAITVWLIRKAIKNSKNGYTINTYKFV